MSCIVAVAARWTKSLKFTLSIAVHRGGLAKNHFWLVASQKKRITIYFFTCDLCDSDYVGFTARHLHQRIVEHKNSAIGKHFSTAHGDTNLLKESHLHILKKCQGKFDCLVYEILFIEQRNPCLNTQTDSIREKLFVLKNIPLPIVFLVFTHFFLSFTLWLDNDVSQTSKRPQHIFNMPLRNVSSQFFIVKCFKTPLLFRIIMFLYFIKWK